MGVICPRRLQVRSLTCSGGWGWEGESQKGQGLGDPKLRVSACYLGSRRGGLAHLLCPHLDVVVGCGDDDIFRGEVAYIHGKLIGVSQSLDVARPPGTGCGEDCCELSTGQAGVQFQAPTLRRRGYTSQPHLPLSHGFSFLWTPRHGSSLDGGKTAPNSENLHSHPTPPGLEQGMSIP